MLRPDIDLDFSIIFVSFNTFIQLQNLILWRFNVDLDKKTYLLRNNLKTYLKLILFLYGIIKVHIIRVQLVKPIKLITHHISELSPIHEYKQLHSAYTIQTSRSSQENREQVSREVLQTWSHHRAKVQRTTAPFEFIVSLARNDKIALLRYLCRSFIIALAASLSRLGGINLRGTRRCP